MVRSQRTFFLVCLAGCVAWVAGAADDSLATAVAKPVLSKVLAGSSEMLAMSALAEADLAADEAWRAVKTREELVARQARMRKDFLSRKGASASRRFSSRLSPASG